MTYRHRTPRTMMNAASSTTKVMFGIRKLPPAASGCDMACLDRLAEHEHKQGHECEVDEVHRLAQADRGEEDREQAGLRFRLPGDTVDGGATGETVADRGADGTPAEQEAAADERTRGFECLFHVCCGHWPSLSTLHEHYVTGLGRKRQ